MLLAPPVTTVTLAVDVTPAVVAVPVAVRAPVMVTAAVDVTPAAAPLRGQAYLVATAEVETGADRLVPGLQVPVAVETEPQTPLDHARDLFGW